MAKCCKGKLTQALKQKYLLSSDSPPVSARIRNLVGDSYAFLGLYVTTLFSVRWNFHTYIYEFSLMDLKA